MDVMFTEIYLPASICFLSTFLALSVSVLSWQRRLAHGAIPMCCMMLATAIWSFTFGLELFQTDLQLKIFIDQIQYLGSATVAPLFMIFAFDFAGFSAWTSWKRLLPVFTIPACTIILAFTNSWHGLIWKSFELQPGMPNIAMIQGGPAFWILLVGFSYICLCIGFYQLIRAYFRFPLQFRSHIKIVLVAVSLPFLSDVLYLADLTPVKNLDPTSPILAISGALITWGILRANLLNIVPVAREAVIERMPDGLLVLDQHLCILDVNPSARKLLNSTIQIGQPFAALPQPWATLNAALTQNKSGSTQLQLGKKEDTIWVEVSYTPMLNEHREVGSWFLLLHDISENHRMLQELRMSNKQLHSLATRDSLTRLYSRRFLEESLERELSRARRDNLALSLVIIDIDNFKKFNEDFGALAGDACLRKIANVLLTNSRGEDIACRFGGEEFVIALPGLNITEALAMTEKWFRFVDVPTISAGIASFPEHGRTRQALLQAAESALAQAKRTGRNRIEIANNSSNSNVTLLTPTIPE